MNAMIIRPKGAFGNECAFHCEKEMLEVRQLLSVSTKDTKLICMHFNAQHFFAGRFFIGIVYCIFEVKNKIETLRACQSIGDERYDDQAKGCIWKRMCLPLRKGDAKVINNRIYEGYRF